MGEEHIKSDRYLVEACLENDITAWSSLIDKYSGLVYISIKNRLEKYGLPASQHDVEDIKQNVFTDIWKNSKLETITNRDDISYWIAVLSGNAAVEYFRTKNVRQELKSIPLNELIQSDAIDPKDNLARAEAETKIDEAIETLPEKEKLIIKLHLIDDKKYYDIADMMGIPRGTVSNYIKRAKGKLRKALKNI